MRKWIQGFCIVGVVIALGSLVRSANAPTASLLGYTTAGPYTGALTYTLVDPFNVTASLIVNNLTVTGTQTVGAQNGTNETLSGMQVFSPASVTASSFTTIPVSTSYVQLLSTGTGPVTLGGPGCANVAIATATAVNGEFLVISATTTANYVVIDTGTNCGVSGPIFPISTLNKGASFIFESASGVWKELDQ